MFDKKIQNQLKIVFEQLDKDIPIYLFSEQGNRKRLRIVCKETVIGEIIFQDNPVNIISCNVLAVFYTFITPKNLIAHSVKKFPGLLKPQPYLNMSAEAEI